MSETSISTLTFTGLLAGGATSSDISNVVVEIYRVFPDLSDVGRTSGPPTFSTPQVPTRVNSPSDVALLSRDSSLGELNATTTSISPSFTANNSVLQHINPQPNQTTVEKERSPARKLFSMLRSACQLFCQPDITSSALRKNPADWRIDGVSRARAFSLHCLV